jgi:hypothetical protein
LEGLLLVFALVAIGWLIYWTIKAENTGGASAGEWPFGYRMPEQNERPSGAGRRRRGV